MRRLTQWQKGVVEWREGDTVHLSIVFTWDADDAWQRTMLYRAQGLKVRIGGPGAFVGRRELAKCGAEIGGDITDAVARHNPMATFASRGCPVGCWFCIVPAMEGRSFTLIDDFPLRPILCDNNLSALPAAFQDHVVERYRKAGQWVWDANSGFEPLTFDREVLERWRAINRGPWRFAYDEADEREPVERVMQMLKGAEIRNPKKIRVYTLIGNEPMAACLERILEVIAWGGEPHAQPLMKLNARRRRPWVRHDWSERTLRQMARWVNRRYWKYATFEEFQHWRRGERRTPDTALMA